MATQLYLAITDGTAASCLFGDGSGGSTNFKLVDESWAPAVAGVRLDQFGGRGPYTDVVEDMAIDITGSTAIACLNNVSQLQNLMNQADRWYRGENVSAVQVWYSPPGGSVSSAASPLKAAILGRVDGDSALTFSPTFQQDSKNAFVANARLRFRRRGAWLHTAETATGSAAHGNEVSATFSTAVEYFSPTTVGVENWRTGNDIDPGLFVIASSPGRITIVDAAVNAGASAQGYTVVSSSATQARGGSVVRYTPTGTSAQTAIVGASMSWATYNRYLVLASMRNNSTTTNFLARFALNASANGAGYTQYKAIPGESGSPARWYNMGYATVYQGNATSTGSLFVEVTASSASGTLDIDSIILLHPDAVQVFTAQQVTGGYSVGDQSATIDHRALTAPNPYINNTSSGSRAVGYSGDIYVSTSGASARAVLLQTRNQYWNTDGAGSASTTGWSLTRTRAYLTPV